ncbi:head GIN domain-containing protein [Flavobacterium sp. JP2137]|uniref:head GIN domain-containing protein n=1 Tax=Flavobacterium sp. JP2137 TaxID=3414510 RepID=UPI003D2FC5F8
MKRILFIGLFLVAQAAVAQTVKQVGEFTSLKVFDKIQAVLVPSNEFKVELSGGETDQVEIVNKNGSLRLKMALSKTLQGDGIKAIVYYKNLDAIEVNEGATIESESVIDDVALTINAKTGGKISLKVKVERLNIKASSGGITLIKGKAKMQDIIANSGAFVNHKDLETEQTDVTVNAGGQAEVRASLLVDAKTRAGGIISIYGDPKTINEKTIAGGSIKKVKK